MDHVSPHCLIADPLFVSLIAGKEDFHLKKTSPAIDSGVDIGMLFDGDRTTIPQLNAPDIGAYEYIDDLLCFSVKSQNGKIAIICM